VCGFFVVGALISDNTNSAIATQLPRPGPVVLEAGLLWPQTKAEAEFPSTDGAVVVPTYQPPADSLFEELKKSQTPRQFSPQSAMPNPVRVSFSNP
jgi:hypothetical protein